MVLKQTGILIIVIAFLFGYFFYRQPEKPVDKKVTPKETYLPNPILEINTTSSCFEILNMNFAETKNLYMLLLPEKKELSYQQIIQMIIYQEKNTFGTVEKSKNYTLICGLTQNHTYYFYSFVESTLNRDLRSRIEIQVIHTKYPETFWTEIKLFRNIILAFLFILSGICFILLFFHYRRGKLRDNSGSFRKETPSEKIIREWKLVIFFVYFSDQLGFPSG